MEPTLMIARASSEATRYSHEAESISVLAPNTSVKIVSDQLMTSDAVAAEKAYQRLKNTGVLGFRM
ncbi:hypothetical protein SDJN02_14134, partial [Cucurbita argyrosperma subsp. argyrosperma]